MESTMGQDVPFTHVLVDLAVLPSFFQDIKIQDYARAQVHFHCFADMGFDDVEYLPETVKGLMNVTFSRMTKSIRELTNRNIIFKAGQLSALAPDARFYIATPYNAALAVEHIMLGENLNVVPFATTKDLAYVLKKDLAATAKES